MNSQQKLVFDTCVANAPKLKQLPGVNMTAVLCAIAENESSFGMNNRPVHEKAYDYGGYYYRVYMKKPEFATIKGSFKKWGSLMACSYGPWQIMAPVAYELGYRGNPVDLSGATKSIPWVVKLINYRIIGKDMRITRDSTNDLVQLADAYNSGNYRDGNIPWRYVERFLKNYEDWNKRLKAAVPPIA